MVEADQMRNSVDEKAPEFVAQSCTLFPCLTLRLRRADDNVAQHKRHRPGLRDKRPKLTRHLLEAVLAIFNRVRCPYGYHLMLRE